MQWKNFKTALLKRRQQLKGLTYFDGSAIFLALAAYLTFSFVTITKFSIWFDEAFSAYIIRFDFWQVAMYTASDVQPPLYYWLLKLWSMGFGTSELALRSLSVLFGGVALVFAYLLIKRLFSMKAAALGVLFMALTPIFIRYSQEVRMYTLVLAIAIAATYALVIAVQQKSRRAWLWYSILVALGMWTHYFTALVWLSHITWHAFMVWQPGDRLKEFRQKFFAKEWVRAYLLAILFYLPWLPAFVIQALTVQTAGFWIPPVTALTIPNFFTDVFLYHDIAELTLFDIGLMSMLVLISVFIFWKAVRQKLLNNRFYCLLVAMGTIPIVLLTIISFPPLRSVFIDRYLITSAVCLAIILGVSIAVVKMRLILKVIAAMGIAVVMLVGISNVQGIGNYNKNSHVSNNVRYVIEQIREAGVNGQPIVADSPWLFYEAVFYDRSDHPVYFVDANVNYYFGSVTMLKNHDQFKIKDIKEFSKQRDSVWYISTLTEGKKEAPDASWQPIHEIVIDDPVSNKPLYRLVEYKL